MKRLALELSDSDSDDDAPSTSAPPPKRPRSQMLCAADGCAKRASYGPRGTTSKTHCAAHGKPLGFVDTAHPRCVSEGCETRPIYGPRGATNKTHCAAHGKPLGFVDNSHPHCTVPGCDTRPSFGTVWMQPVHCAEHKTDDEWNVVSPRCAKPGCDKIPSYGKEGTTEKTHCATHGKPLGFVDNSNARCTEPGCDKQSTFGTERMKPIHCVSHKTDDEWDVKNERCNDPGCVKRPSFGTVWMKPIHCVAHKTDEEKNVVKASCVEPGCDTLPTFGTEWMKPIHCAAHKIDGERDVTSRRCIEPGCETKPTFGVVWMKPLHCAAHKTDDEHDVISTRCVGRDGKGCYFDQRAYYGDKCAYCTTDPKAGKIIKKTETRCIKAIMKRLGGIATHTEQLRIDYKCTGATGSRADIDLVLDHPNVRVLLEVDERRHDREEELCRLARMYDATAELRAQSADPRPIAWVRFNPDDGTTTASARDQLRRCDDAVKAVRELISNPRNDIVYVNY